MTTLSPTWAILMAAASAPPAPPPAPHARVKPNITLAMLEALKVADASASLVILLLHDITGVNIGVIGVILDAIPQLEKRYLKPTP